MQFKKQSSSVALKFKLPTVIFKQKNKKKNYLEARKANFKKNYLTL